MKICSFSVPGRAVPAVRMTQRSKYSRPAKRYLSYKNQVAWIAKASYKSKPTDSNVGVNLNIYLKGGNQGDIDNYFKSVTDSLNEIIYSDDRQVKEMSARKLDCHDEKDERVEVVVYEL